MTDSKPSVSEIIACVAERFGAPVDEILSDRKERRIARVRQAAMALAHELTWQSYPAIGRAFRRDHTTVMYAVRRARALAEHDLDFAARLAACREALAPGGAP
jgi:chromosomal replication initiator protein